MEIAACLWGERQSFSNNNDNDNGTRIVNSHLRDGGVPKGSLFYSHRPLGRNSVVYRFWKLPRNHQISHKRTIHRKCTDEDTGLIDRQVGLRRIVMIHKSKL
jgi:hypothetical protein